MPSDRGNHGVPGGPPASLACPQAGALAAARRLALLNLARQARPAVGQRLAAIGRGLATRYLADRIVKPQTIETALRSACWRRSSTSSRWRWRERDCHNQPAATCAAERAHGRRWHRCVMANDPAIPVPNPVQRRDVEVLIGILAVLDGVIWG